MRKATTEQARALRRRSTNAERILWYNLRGGQINGTKWRRQVPIDQYIVDFLCAKLRVILELDGDVHVLEAQADRARQAYLEAQGFLVLRFTNVVVVTNLNVVLNHLWWLTSELLSK